jgi:N-acetylmuramoyl-L-alanine amidase
MAAAGGAAIPNLRSLTTVVVHHSAGPRGQSFEAIAAHHTAPKPRGNGWAACGYHVVITADGALHYGRALPQMGAHCPGLNYEAIGVCLVGDNTRTSERWTAEQILALRRYIAALRVVAPGLRIIGHRDAKATLCPGISTERVLAMLEER